MMRNAITRMYRKNHAPRLCRLAALFVCFLLLGSLLPGAALAAAGTQDGLEAELATDKTVYAVGDMVNVTVSMRNANPFAVPNVQVDVSLPDGFALTAGHTSTIFPSFTAGEAGEISLSAKVEKDPTPSQSSSIFPLLLWVGLGLVLAAVLVVVLVRRKNKKKHKHTPQQRPRTYSLLLCLVLALSAQGLATTSRAAPVRKSFFVTETVMVGETGVPIVAQVSYDWEEAVPVTGIALNVNTLSLVQGGPAGTLAATVSPADATDPSVSWASSNPAVATVLDGVVTAVAPGAATITATTADGGKQATCEVQVASATIPVTGLTLSPNSLSLTKGGAPGSLIVTVTPADATNQSVTWASSRPSVATVSGGIVTPVGAGNATITATTVDGGKQASCVVTVTTATVPVTGVTLSPNTLSLVQGGAAGTLVATVVPANATNRNVSWTSNKPSVATVSNGVVTAVGPGSATIAVTTADGGKQASCAVTVTAATVPVTGVTLSPNPLALTQGGPTGTMTATVSPANATNKKVTWKSNNPAVATVSNGVVTPVGPGTATITVTTADGGKQAAAAATVTAATVPVTGVTLSPNPLALTQGGPTGAMTATVSPANATNKKVTWKSDNPAVATVSDGVVTPVGPGTATITVTTADGNKQATAAVTVTAATIPVTGVSLDRTNIDGWDMDSTPRQSLVATVSPANATNQGVSWASSDSAVAMVSNGVVTAVGPGTATITVTTDDGGKYATCTVTIIRGGKTAADAEAAKVKGFGADTQDTNTATTLGFPVQLSSELAAGATFQLVSTSIPLGGSMKETTGLLSLNTQNVVDAVDLSDVSLVFTVTVNGTASDPVTLPISALFGEGSTAAKLRMDKATVLALDQTHAGQVSAGATTIPLNAQLSPGVSIPQCPASAHSQWPAGVNAADLSATAVGIGTGTGIVTISITNGALTAGGSGSFAFVDIALSCAGATYVLPSEVTIAVDP